MFCPQCGAAVSGGDPLCPLCGASLVPPEAACEEETSPFSRLLGAEDPAPAPEAPSGPAPGTAEDAPPPPPYGGVPDVSAAPPVPPKRRRTGLVAGLCAAAALIVAAVFAVPSVIQALNPAAYVAASLGRTLAAMGKPLEELGLGAVFKSAAEGPTSQEISFSIPGVGPDRFGMLLESDPKGDKAALTLSLDAGADRLLTLRSFLDGDLLSFTSPELLEDRWYSLHTATLGADFNASVMNNGYNTMEEDVGFDLFGDGASGADKETAKALSALWKEYGAAMTVEKSGKDVPVADGWTLNGSRCHLRFPAEALREYVRGAAYALLEDDAVRPSLIQFLMPFDYDLEPRLQPAFHIPPIFDWPDNREDMYALADNFANGIQGDLDMDFYIADKLVRRVTADFSYTDYYGDTTGFTLNMVFGKENSVTDALSARLIIDDAHGERTEIGLDSAGRHTPIDGIYDDTTTLGVSQSNVTLQLFQCSTVYDSASGAFSFNLTIPDGSQDSTGFTSEGTVLIDPAAKTFSAELQNKLSSSYPSFIKFSTFWSISPMAGFSVQPTEPTPFFSMTGEEYTSFMETVSGNLMSVLQRLYA